MIPDLIDHGGPWKVLPPGKHGASLDDIEMSFATNEHRKRIFDGMKRGIKSLIVAGCNNVYLNGSFVTNKINPNDYDACWETIGVDDTKLDPVLLEFDNKRAAQKQKYQGEFFPANFQAKSGISYLEFFQIDKYTGYKKGIIQLSMNVRN